jgi:hypothetical protein
VLTNVPDKVSDELLLLGQLGLGAKNEAYGNVLDGVKSETVSSGLFEDPLSPIPAGQRYSALERQNSLDLLGDLGVSVID